MLDPQPPIAGRFFQKVMRDFKEVLIDAEGYNRVRGKPFRIAEIVEQAERILGGGLS